MVSLITNHVIMWKPQWPQRINESLLDKMNDCFWTGYWWWLSMGEMSGLICKWLYMYIYFDELSEFWDYVEAFNWIWKMHWKCRVTLDNYFSFNIRKSWRNYLNLHHAVLKKIYLDPLFTESNSITWVMLHTHLAKENDTAIRHSGSGGGGSCYICSAAVNCGL